MRFRPLIFFAVCYAALVIWSVHSISFERHYEPTLRAQHNARPVLVVSGASPSHRAPPLPVAATPPPLSAPVQPSRRLHIRDLNSVPMWQDVFEGKYKHLPRRTFNDTGSLAALEWHQPGSVPRRYCYVPSQHITAAYSGLRERGSTDRGEWDWVYENDMVPELAADVQPRMYLSDFSAEALKHGVQDMFDGGAAPTIVMVTHGTVDRVLQMVPGQAEQWQAPMSVSVLIRSNADLEQLSDMVQQHDAVRKYVDLHIMKMRNVQSNYAVNVMRNLAQLFAIDVEWVFVVDIDGMVTAPASFYEYRIAINEQEQYREMRDAECAGLYVYVVAAWGLKFHLKNMYKFGNGLRSDVPPTPEGAREYKKRISNAVYARDIQPMLPKFKPAYYQTKYERWMVESEPYVVRFRDYYEPYYIVRQGHMPFDELFYGYGGNYNQQTLAMALGGYGYIVDPFLSVLDLPRGRTSHKPRVDGVGLARRGLSEALSSLFGAAVPNYLRSFDWEKFIESAAPVDDFDGNEEVEDQHYDEYEGDDDDAQDAELNWNDRSEESKKWNVVNHPTDETLREPHTITVISGQTVPLDYKYCVTLVSAAARGGRMPAVIGADYNFRSLWDKMPITAEYLATLPEYQFVVVFDGSDVLSNREVDSIYEVFLEYDTNIVVSVETHCYPSKSHCQFQDHIARENHLEHLLYRWLNSGVVAGYAGAIRYALERIMHVATRLEQAHALTTQKEKMVAGDQYWWSRALPVLYDEVAMTLDYEQKLSFSHAHAEPGSFRAHSVHGPDMVISRTNFRPYFHHFNGKAPKALFLRVSEQMLLFREKLQPEIRSMVEPISGLSLGEMCCGDADGLVDSGPHDFCDSLSNRHGFLTEQSTFEEMRGMPCDGVNLKLLEDATSKPVLYAGIDVDGRSRWTYFMREQLGIRTVNHYNTESGIPRNIDVESVSASGCELLRARWNKGKRYAYGELPWALFYREFTETFGDDARVLVIVQDEDEWIRSIGEQWEMLPIRWLTFAFGMECMAGPGENCDSQLRFAYRSHLQSMREYFASRSASFMELRYDELTAESAVRFARFVGLPQRTDVEW